MQEFWMLAGGSLVFTSSMIGHSEIRLSIDVKGFPVPGTVCLQSLEPHKSFSFFAPLVNHREVRLWFFVKMLVWPSAGVRHHQKYLDPSKKAQGISAPHITFTSWMHECIRSIFCNTSLAFCHLLAHAEVSPSQSSICADILVELETCLGPQIHSRARGWRLMSHSSHQTHARYLEHLLDGKKQPYCVEEGNHRIPKYLSSLVPSVSKYSEDLPTV